MKNLSVTYKAGQVPEGRPFTIKGINLTFVRTASMVEAQPNPEASFLDMLKTAGIKEDTETELVRPIYAIDPTTIVASFQNNFLMDTGDGYTLETFDERGEVHFARYFRPQNLHRAVAALQELMPEQIPHWANTQITRPNGSQQYSSSDVYNLIRDTFFVGYDGALNSVEDMERILNADGWDFNDLTKEQSLCSNEVT